MLISKYIILIFFPSISFISDFFLCRRRERYRLRRAYTVATPLPAVQHRRYIRRTRIQTYVHREIIYTHTYLHLHDCVASENETDISAGSAPAGGQRLPLPASPSCSAWGIALFNKPRRKDVNKAAGDK